MKTRSAHRSLLIVGSVALDDIDGPFGLHKDVLGGSASFIARAASYFTRDVSVVAVVGDDFPQHYLDEMTALGIDASGVERQAGETFHWAGRYSDDLASRETLDTKLGVFASFQPRLSQAQRDASLVFLGNIDPILQRDVVEQTEGPLLVAADTMNFWIHGEPAALAALLKRIDLLIINDEEARDLSGISNILKAAADIRKRGPSRLIIKRGEHGALLFDDEGVFFAPAYPLETVLDPTGAGDSFAGGLMGSLASDGEVTAVGLRRAMYFASAMGSFCVEDIGSARLHRLTRSELEDRVEGFRRMVDFGGSLSLPAPASQSAS